MPICVEFLFSLPIGENKKIVIIKRTKFDIYTHKKTKSSTSALFAVPNNWYVITLTVAVEALYRT